MKTGKFFLLALTAIISLSLNSCDNEKENLNITGIKGRPGNMKSEKNGNDYDENISFYYQGDRLTRLVAKGGPGDVYNFKYDGTELISYSGSPEDKRVADGNLFCSFKKTNNIITIESAGDPSFDTYAQEMELDDNGIPLRITETGLYGRREDGIKKILEGRYYTEFTFDDSGNLIKMEKYTIAESQLVCVSTFEYDNEPGVMSEINFPLWFSTYWNESRNFYTGGYNKMFLNYVNNVVRMTIDDTENDRHLVENYTYIYGKGSYPLLVKYSDSGEIVKINY